MAGKELDPYASPEAFFGAEVRNRREARGWSQAKLAKIANMSESRIAQIEGAHFPATLDNATALDVALETGGMFARLWRFINMLPIFPDWVQRYMALKIVASAISSYAPILIPGLLQTEEYARAILRAGRPRDTEEEVERRVQARIALQEIISRKRPPALWFILEEEVLCRPVGGRKVMVGQLERLADLASNPSVVIQILPTNVGAHAGLGGVIDILDRADGPQVAYVEGPFTGQLFEDTDRVTECAVVYDLLRTRASSREESVQMIHTALEFMKR
ncbi:helix-turn-helix transcriptional regulator [Streptomyces sp. NPDC003077]|uniref:helix-turn-helix domain-containing protein n=1 Tax=Streptomyces sp. NPDC003077 TaxID=3154443 RepID=UPI0033A63FF9